MKNEIASLYRTLLNREVDTSGLAHWLAHVSSGMPLSEVERQICASAEYQQLEQRKDSASDLLHALHRSRVELVRQLPVAKRILDLGGGAVGDKRGALVVMGYPYQFDELNIIEPPSESRHDLYKHVPDLIETVPTTRGPVKYHYGSMSDLTRFTDSSFDLVFSGETIEHVSLDDCRKTLAEVRRVLTDEGSFCFDTPNRAVTKIQIPHGYINPEHKIEYTHDEMRTLLIDAGLKIVEQKGVTFMPNTVRSAKFCDAEMLGNVGVYADLERCYLLYYRCMKG